MKVVHLLFLMMHSYCLNFKYASISRFQQLSASSSEYISFVWTKQFNSCKHLALYDYHIILRIICYCISIIIYYYCWASREQRFFARIVILGEQHCGQNPHGKSGKSFFFFQFLVYVFIFWNTFFYFALLFCCLFISNFGFRMRAASFQNVLHRHGESRLFQELRFFLQDSL